jgi:hypothetical protein
MSLRSARRLARALVGDPDRLKSLSTITDAEAFAQAVATEETSADDIFRTIHRQGDTPEVENPLAGSLAGWIPVQLLRAADEACIDWLWFGDLRLTHPFFEDSQRLARALPLNRFLRRRTPLEALATIAPPLPLAGLVFHLSRCGSTLVSQMLAASPDLVVLSEPPILDQILRMSRAEAWPEADRRAVLRGVVAALSQPRTGLESRAVIKLDSWHITDQAIFADAFPKTPWVFLHREPLEVMVSHAAQPGIHMVPGMVDWPEPAPAFDPASSSPMADYAAQALARLLDAALAALARGGVAVDYASLGPDTVEQFCNLFSLEPTDDERTAMRSSLRRDAKNPDRTFESDQETKRSRVTDDLRQAATARIGDRYERLKALGAGPGPA